MKELDDALDVVKKKKTVLVQATAAQEVALHDHQEAVDKAIAIHRDFEKMVAEWLPIGETAARVR